MALLPWKRTDRGPNDQASTFEDLALPLLPALYNTASWLTRNPSDAEDLVQEALLKALRGFSTFEPGSNFKAWIFRILRNSYLNSRAGIAAQRTVSLDERLEADSAYPEEVIEMTTPETSFVRLSDRAAVEEAMESLSPPLLEVILLCDVEDMKYKEIALVLGVPIGTVMSRIARARMAMRARLTGSAAVFNRETRA